MKKVLIAGIAVMALAFGLWSVVEHSNAKWSGVDESVVEKFAEEANRPARKPLIDIDKGDLPLLCFLVAGAAGGFVAGYYFRELFPPQSEASADAKSV
jgi:ABC-type cobalt transport system substrate-binding protein